MDNNKLPMWKNLAAPEMARKYWRLPVSLSFIIGTKGKGFLLIKNLNGWALLQSEQNKREKAIKQKIYLFKQINNINIRL